MMPPFSFNVNSVLVNFISSNIKIIPETYSADSGKNSSVCPMRNVLKKKKKKKSPGYSGIVIKYLAQLKVIYHHRFENKGVCKFSIIGK